MKNIVESNMEEDTKSMSECAVDMEAPAFVSTCSVCSIDNDEDSNANDFSLSLQPQQQSSLSSFQESDEEEQVQEHPTDSQQALQPPLLLQEEEEEEEEQQQQQQHDESPQQSSQQQQSPPQQQSQHQEGGGVVRMWEDRIEEEEILSRARMQHKEPPMLESRIREIIFMHMEHPQFRGLVILMVLVVIFNAFMIYFRRPE